MAPSLSPEAIHILKSTAPVVKTEGTKITCRMYEIMFEKYPVVNNLFNTTHVRKTGDTNSVPPQVSLAYIFCVQLRPLPPTALAKSLA